MSTICDKCVYHNAVGCMECHPQTKEEYAAAVIELTLDAVMLQAHATTFTMPTGIEMDEEEWLLSSSILKGECLKFVEQTCNTIKTRLEI